MTDPCTALTALITEHSGLTGVRAGRLTDKIAAEWPPAQGVERWWITQDAFLERGGKRVLGPFGSKGLALDVRAYVEKATGQSTVHLLRAPRPRRRGRGDRA